MKKTFEIKGVDLTNLYGVGDKNISFIEKKLPITLNIRGNNIFCQGLKKDILHFDSVLNQMIDSIKKGNNLSTKDINQLIAMNGALESKNTSVENVIFYGKKGPVFPRTDGQKNLVKAFLKNDIIISVGPAGTGKTFLAVAYALSLLEKHEIEKIIFCRPAVEAGENLGFLPGDLKDKIDPYLAPLYDALYELLPKNKIQNFLDRGIIEIIPLAYMRGRTINRSAMILDEAQNASSIQMKMFLTRLGIESRAIITGDESQIDLPKKSNSGLIDVLKILKNINDIGIVKLNKQDIARHHLVKHIIDAYSKSKK
ncbi:MAG: phosphate starvation-inducible protein PhoH [Actinobacteria bacterium]|nr:phosphate starvation-inducible protein PhoH [Actinomycetota bacterium]